MKCSEVFWCQALADTAKILNDGTSAVAAVAVFLAALAGKSVLANLQDKRNLKRKMKYVKRTAIAVKRARIALDAIRNSPIVVEEEDLAKIDLNKIHRKNKDFVADAHHVAGMVYLKRFMKEKKHVDNIRECALTANISLGDDAEEFESAFNTILNGFDEVLMSASYLSEVGEKNGMLDNVEHFAILQEGFLEEIEKGIFENVRNCMDAIEDRCIDVLKPIK